MSEEEEEGGGDDWVAGPDIRRDPAEERPSDNPLSGVFDVTVSVPETLEIRMVDATVLNDYEVWNFIASLLGASVVGFGVAYLQNTKDITLLAVTLMFLLLFAIAVRMTLGKRRRITTKSKSIRLR